MAVSALPPNTPIGTQAPSPPTFAAKAASLHLEEDAVLRIHDLRLQLVRPKYEASNKDRHTDHRLARDMVGQLRYGWTRPLHAACLIGVDRLCEPSTRFRQNSSGYPPRKPQAHTDDRGEKGCGMRRHFRSLPFTIDETTRFKERPASRAPVFTFSIPRRAREA